MTVVSANRQKPPKDHGSSYVSYRAIEVADTTDLERPVPKAREDLRKSLGGDGVWYLQSLQSIFICANKTGMAFITLRRTRGTQGYYLVESYRDDQGRSRKRTLCYLGREQDGTDTLDNAIAHWERVADRCRVELRIAKADRKATLRKRRDAAMARIGILKKHARLALVREAEKKRREEELEFAKHWHAIELLRRHPSEENAQAAKRAFLTLAKRHHPDQGGNHHDFLRLKDIYDRAKAAWRHSA